MKGADEALKAKIFKNMSQRAAEMLKDDLEAKGPVKLSEVEAAQKEILAAARKLAEAGTIALGGKGEAVCLSVAASAAPRWAAAHGRRARSSAGAPMRRRTAIRSRRASHSRGLPGRLAAAPRGDRRRQIDALKARVARLDAILKLLARPLEELDAEVEQQLTLLALTVGKQIVRRELKTDPAQIVAVIRESVGAPARGGARHSRAAASGGCRRRARDSRDADRGSRLDRSSKILRSAAAAAWSAPIPRRSMRGSTAA